MSDKNAWRHWWFQTAGAITVIEEMFHALYPDPDEPGTTDELRAMRDLSAALTALSALTAEWEPA